MIARLVAQTLAYVVILGALLFVSAGTWHWPQAWIFLGETLVSSLLVGGWLARHDPALLDSRLTMTHRDQAGWDQAFLALAMVLYLGWIVAMGLEVRRAGPAQFSAAVEAIGAAAIALCMLLVWQVFAANSFAAPQVRIQAARDHRVIDRGPYAVVRHPMYSGAILYFVGASLLLGSSWGLAAVPLFLAGFAWRVLGEEAVLRQALPGYCAYAEKVRARLVPGLW